MVNTALIEWNLGAFHFTVEGLIEGLVLLLRSFVCDDDPWLCLDGYSVLG